MSAPSKPRPRARRVLAWLYVALLLASFGWRAAHPPVDAPAPDEAVATLRGVRVEAGSATRGPEAIDLAYADRGPREAPAVLLLHGSPGRGADLAALAGELAGERRVIATTMPGFGGSSFDVPDYGARAYADYALQLLDALGLERVHVVGHSLGGAVALHMAGREPERIASTTMLAALGVVELELFGDQDLNHLIHGGQLAAIRAARVLLPHFGALDRFALGVPYARNFYDTDQTLLRPLLEKHAGPLLIVHGERDFLIPAAAAREHHRIVPQSELVMQPGGHFEVFRNTAAVAGPIAAFLARVEAGEAATRADASPERLARAAEPFDPTSVPPAKGPALLILLGLFVVGTLISEDLTCIGAGLLVAQGRIEFLPAALACLLGIYVGDLLLFLAGRAIGRPALAYPPVSWILTPPRVERASAWFQRNGVKAIFLSRLMPGLRLPTYFAAGLTRTSLLSFAGYFLLAATVWTPLLVGFSAWVGASLGVEAAQRGSLLAFGGLVLTIFFAQRVLLPLLTARGRRLLVGSWRRKTRWEFWPRWAFYPPILAAIAWEGLRRRSLMILGCANPAIPLGGFVGESKSRILAGLSEPSGAVARFVLIRAADPAEARLEAARRFRREHGLDLPLVCKPDVGERGSGVQILRDEEALARALTELEDDHVLQEYITGPEYGVFYARHPGEPRGRVISITTKRLASVTGDGERTLEELILADERAICMAPFYLDQNAERAHARPSRGEEVTLGELGTHCRGAIFLDGNHLQTEELDARIDALARGFEGFYFGRFDLRAPSEESLRRGEGLRILELNGISSESAHIYDPRYSVRDGWRILIAQWRLAFEIGAANRARGARVPGFGELIAALLGRRESASDPS